MPASYSLNNTFEFKILQKDPKTKARTGIIKTQRGHIQTPVFMPIGTAGTVKGLTFGDLLTMEAQIILGNTYHLWLRPGMQTLKEAGDLHNFGGGKSRF
jgi:queuine tRNA-ribosyltransferase